MPPVRVAISMRIVQNETYTEARDAISHEWISFIAGLGMAPLLVPNVLETPEEFFDLYGAEALILTSGNDVPGHGVKGDEQRDLVPERDRTEGALLSLAVKRGIPVLGVCRGMQFINYFWGGSVVPVNHEANIHRACRHEITIHYQYRAVVGASVINVNSYHNFGVPLSAVAPCLRPFAITKGDGVCEGLFHPDYPVLGLQWHPERENNAATHDTFLIQELFAGRLFWSKA